MIFVFVTMTTNNRHIGRISPDIDRQLVADTNMTSKLFELRQHISSVVMFRSSTPFCVYKAKCGSVRFRSRDQ